MRLARCTAAVLQRTTGSAECVSSPVFSATSNPSQEGCQLDHPKCDNRARSDSVVGRAERTHSGWVRSDVTGTPSVTGFVISEQSAADADTTTNPRRRDADGFIAPERDAGIKGDIKNLL